MYKGFYYISLIKAGLYSPFGHSDFFHVKKTIYINSHCQCWIIFTCESINVIYQFEGCVCSAAGSHLIVAFIQELSQTCWIEINLSHAGMEAYLRQKKRKKYVKSLNMIKQKLLKGKIVRDGHDFCLKCSKMN